MEIFDYFSTTIALQRSKFKSILSSTALVCLWGRDEEGLLADMIKPPFLYKPLEYLSVGDATLLAQRLLHHVWSSRQIEDFCWYVCNIQSGIGKGIRDIQKKLSELRVDVKFTFYIIYTYKIKDKVNFKPNIKRVYTAIKKSTKNYLDNFTIIILNKVTLTQ